MFGFKLARIKGKKPKDFLEGDAYPELENSVSDSIAWEGNIWDVTSERVHVQKYLKIRTVSSATKGIAYFIGIYSEPKAIPAIDELYHLEISDTTLPPASLESIENALDENMTDEGQKKMVIALRIKEFMLLKSKISEEEENTLISSLTSQLKQKINAQSVIIAPYSNLLFIAFNLSQSSVEEVMNKIDRAVTSLSFSNRINSIEYISGISLSPDHGTDIKELLEKAYIALEALNRIKKDKYLLFNESIFSEVSKYYQIKNEIENAFKNNEFTVVYQPQNDVATNEITGMEALVRWNSPVLGPVYPSLFIPIMEEDPTQIKRLGKYILKRVMSECKNLLSQVSPQFRISINLSSQEFSDLNIIIDLMSIIGQEVFPKDKICFEITETILSDDLMLTNSIIEELHSNNVTVAIDDFGTGYSSLGYLKRLNSDKLKIDRVFIKDYPEGDDGSILKAIVKLAREMNMKVIVEGVENEIQRNYIEELGCNEYQGYLFSKPVPIDEILKLSGS